MIHFTDSERNEEECQKNGQYPFRKRVEGAAAVGATAGWLDGNTMLLTKKRLLLLVQQLLLK